MVSFSIKRGGDLGMAVKKGGAGKTSKPATKKATTKKKAAKK